MTWLLVIPKSDGFIISESASKGLAVNGGIAGGVSAAVNAANSKKASDTNLTETERHNQEIELELKKGKGVLSSLAGKISVYGAILKYGLQKLVLGLIDCRIVINGDHVCLGSGLYLRRSGKGIYLGPKGSGLFLGQRFDDFKNF